jgi:hypothetical protein
LLAFCLLYSTVLLTSNAVHAWQQCQDNKKLSWRAHPKGIGRTFTTYTLIPYKGNINGLNKEKILNEAQRKYKKWDLICNGSPKPENQCFDKKGRYLGDEDGRSDWAHLRFFGKDNIPKNYRARLFDTPARFVRQCIDPGKGYKTLEEAIAAPESAEITYYIAPLLNLSDIPINSYAGFMVMAIRLKPLDVIYTRNRQPGNNKY